MSIRATVLRGWLSVTVTPLRTSLAAAAVRAGVRLFSAPRSPSPSQRPQVETASKSSRNSASVMSTLGIGGHPKPEAGWINHPIGVMRLRDCA